MTFRLLLYLPAKSPRPVPVFVGLGFAPNQSVSTDPGITLAGNWIQNRDTKAVELQPALEVLARLGGVEVAGGNAAGPRVRAGHDVLRRHRAGSSSGP